METNHMQAAHFARQIDMDPDHTEKGKARAQAIARETSANPRDYGRRYVLGASILKRYTLKYSNRYRAGTARPNVPQDADGWIEVDAGYLATQPARRLAIFRKR